MYDYENYPQDVSILYHHHNRNVLSLTSFVISQALPNIAMTGLLHLTILEYVSSLMPLILFLSFHHILNMLQDSLRD